jgi:hypothetical protein
MTAELAVKESALAGLTPAQIGGLLEVLGIPDVSALDLDAISPQDKVEIREAYKAQLAGAMAIIAELTAPVRQVMAACEADILRAIPAGASQLPHPTFSVKRMIAQERQRGVAELREFLPATELPSEELVKIVFPKTIDARTVDPDDLERLIKNGAKVEWECDLRKADAAAKAYGGPIAEIIEKATRKVDKGAPFLVIEPKESALKRVGQ